MNRKRFFLLTMMCFGVGAAVAGCEKAYVTLDELKQEEEKELQSDSEEGLINFLTQENSDAAILEMQYAERSHILRWQSS